MKAEIYRDSVYEQAINRALEQSRAKVQALYDLWQSLDLTPCDSNSVLYELIHETEILYQEGCQQKQLAPAGLNPDQVKQYKAKLKLPSGNKLVWQAEQVRQDPYVERDMGLFTVKGDRVELTPKAEDLVKMQSVYAETARQQDFYKKLDTWLSLTNELNKAVGGKLLGMDYETRIRTWSGIFSMNQRSGADPADPVSISPEKLRVLLKSIY